MRIAALGYKKDVLISLETDHFQISHFDSCNSMSSLEAFDAFFLNDPLLLQQKLLDTGKIILINSAVTTLKQMRSNEHCFRVNHWESFVKNVEWEIVGKPSPALDNLFTAMSKKTLFVKDEPGFIAARILAMIINEAHYAMAEKVSTAAEIDVAMKLGTGYPNGPIEWGQKIGLKHIYELLVNLSTVSDRYLPSELLTQLALKD